MKIHKIGKYGREKDLSTKEISDWFAWGVNKLLTEDEIKDGIDNRNTPLESWEKKGHKKVK